MPRSTVVVSPRERFSSILESLPSLFATVPADTPVVVVEGCSPVPVRKGLEALRRMRPFEWVALDRYVTPHEARNIGFERVATEFVAFSDNDMVYEPGWLTALEENAQAGGHLMVAPLICVGPPMATKVHHAGGELLFDMAGDRPRITERHRMKDQTVEAVRADPTLARNEVAEFHCLLARSETVRLLGPLDERLITREQIDMALRVALAGGTVGFEPASVVTYAARRTFDRADLPYHLFRWSDALARRSVAAFEATWGVDADGQRVLGEWISRHRWRAIGTAFPDRVQALGVNRFVREVAMPLERREIAQAMATRAGAPPPRIPADPDPIARTRYFVRRLKPVLVPPAPAEPARPMVVAGMATMPTRGETFPIALHSILPQVDRLYLFLDRFAEPPVAADPKIVVLRSQDFGDLRANGKLLGLVMCAHPTIYLSVDDDILYPPDFARRMTELLAAEPGPAALGVHGARLRTPFASYRDDRDVVHRMAEVTEPMPVAILGTDAAAFDTRALKFDVRAWRQVNMVDLGFA
ncbi:MAG: glycosyltransferase family 2 protein, partial [Alphaproteobacteria bacterium]